MRGLGRTAIVGLLGVAMFAVGGIGLLRRDQVRPQPPLLPPEAGVFLSTGRGGDLDGVIETLQRRVRLVPGDAGAAATLGLAYLQAGRLRADPAFYPRAEEALGQALATDAGSFDGSLGMGLLALGRHDFHEALVWGRRAEELNPYSADSLGVIGDAQIELGRYDAAGRTYQRMVDLRPSLDSLARASYYLELTGETGRAISAMRRAVALAGSPADAAWAGYQLGELYFGIGDLLRARDAYGTAARTDPRSVLPTIGLAKVAVARGETDRGLDLLLAVITRYPSPEAVILAGDVASATGERKLAAEQYSLVRAIDRLAEANGVDTDLELALFDADHGGRPKAVLRNARSAFRRRPSVQAADVLAWALYRSGRFHRADRVAGEALRLGTPSALFHFHAGMIALRLHDRRRAEDHLRTALSINPWFSFLHVPTARGVLERLDAS
jgi:tetratricopeptide (TPR) repeat protein